MKYLIQNKKEFAISVGVFVMTAINLVRAVMSKELTQESIVAFVLALFTLLGWYYNMPTSEENCEKTGEMRLLKAIKRYGNNGEDYLDEPVYDDELAEKLDEEAIEEEVD